MFLYLIYNRCHFTGNVVNVTVEIVIMLILFTRWQRLFYIANQCVSIGLLYGVRRAFTLMRVWYSMWDVNDLRQRDQCVGWSWNGAKRSVTYDGIGHAIVSAADISMPAFEPEDILNIHCRHKLVKTLLTVN